MATGPGVNQSKTAFLKEFLPDNRDATLTGVNRAWGAAGHDGTISESLFGKIRSRLGLTGKSGSNGRATEEHASSGAKPKSSPKGAKGKVKKAEEAPARPDLQEGEKGPSKSAFVGEVLGREPGANLKKVNEAWASAGHEGAISPSIYYKIKRETGGTGEMSPGESAKSTPESATKEQDAGPASHETSEAGPETEGVAVATRPVTSPSSGDREKVLDRVEDGIDDLIIELKRLGGMEEALEAMRKARRVVVRSHEG